LIQSEKDPIPKLINLLDRKIHKEFTPSINAKGLDNWTALHFAAENCGYDVIDFLLSKRAKVNLLSSVDRSPLHIASLKNNEAAVQLLLTNKADPNIQDTYYFTPLHYAA